ncbi:hypothetical protein PF008_g33163 [Phytophthora fragariae]|uniref:Uncharacterized protein n=1 Tax=Phytophthora fragariae TaxID=53985 RepID=A0A6G0PXQ7_9STRA|nr:hypothetical protein PF008_g33163 [Phytophthora fragariae]
MKQLIGMHPEAELTPREKQRKLYHDEEQRGKQQKSEYAGAE